MLRYLAEAELAAQQIPNSGPFNTELSFTTPNLNLIIQQAKKQLQNLNADPLVLQATALTYVYLLSTKTDATSESYVASLTSETELP